MCEVKLRAEGDDNLNVWQYAERAPTEEDWKEMGWKMKVETPESVCTASFCGNVFDLYDKIVVVDPREALINFGWVRKVYVNAGPNLLLQILRSKALSMAHQYNGCPMLGIFGRHIVELTAGIKMRQSIVDTMNAYDREEYLSIVGAELPAHIEPSESNRQLVYSLYGITASEQVAFEKSVPQIKLWSAIEPNFCCSKSTSDCWDKYTSVVGSPWVFEGPTCHDEVERVIRSFGEITSGFVDTFYDR